MSRRARLTIAHVDQGAATRVREPPAPCAGYPTDNQGQATDQHRG
jgi:hypothetical protein